MLPSCIICKKRKKKCDFNLPSCKHCESMGAHCEYYDEGLGNNVPREYLKSLDDNITLLKSEIEKYKKKIDKRTANNDIVITNKNKLYETVKNGTFIEGRDSVLQYYGPCSLVSMVYMSSIMLKLKNSSIDQISVLEYKAIPPVKVSFDYSLITNDHSRILISNYLNNIYPYFPLLSESFFHFDLMVKNYPDSKQMYIILILLVSSAQIMRKRWDFITIKVMLQQKVVEMMKTKLGNEDGDTLLILLFYALYELLDPEVGVSVWKTLSLACDIAERLQLKNYDDTIPLPGTISKSIPRSNFLKVLTLLDTETMICIGKLPLIDLTNGQYLITDNRSMELSFVEAADKMKFFKTLYENTSGCDISKLFQYPNFHNRTNSDLWLIASPILSHRCSVCDVYFDSTVIEISRACISVITEYSNVHKKGILLYWIALSKLSIAIIDLTLIKKFYNTSYYGTISDGTIKDIITMGKQLLSQISSQWYYANTVKLFIDAITE